MPTNPNPESITSVSSGAEVITLSSAAKRRGKRLERITRSYNPAKAGVHISIVTLLMSVAVLIVGVIKGSEELAGIAMLLGVAHYFTLSWMSSRQGRKDVKVTVDVKPEVIPESKAA